MTWYHKRHSMTTQRSLSQTVLLVGILLATFFLGVVALPGRVHAEGTGANAQCVMWNPACPCGQGIVMIKGQCPGSGNTANCPPGICKDMTNGIPTDGICVLAGKCKAVTSGGKGVDSGLSQLGQLLGKALEALKGGGGGGGGSGSGSGSGGGSGSGRTDSSGCSGVPYQVSTPSSDPCAQYVPSISDNLSGTPNTSTANDLLNALNGGNGNTIPTGSTSATNTADGAAQAAAQANSVINMVSNPANLNLSSIVGSTSGAVLESFSSFFNIRSLVPGPNPNQATGPQGDVLLTNTGATISASNQDIQNNTAVSGFFGADTFAVVRAEGIGGWLCQKRPWASSFLSKLIPDTFFDGLCAWRGYQVGVPSQAPAPVLTQTPVQKKTTIATTTTATTTTMIITVEPRVQIWAVPAAVRVGSRTSVFWNTQGVSNCIETSPDGSFNQTSLSGGASTVPLTSPTTFSISCIAPNGAPVTGYFTVNISN